MTSEAASIDAASAVSESPSPCPISGAATLTSIASGTRPHRADASAKSPGGWRAWAFEDDGSGLRGTVRTVGAVRRSASTKTTREDTATSGASTTSRFGWLQRVTPSGKEPSRRSATRRATPSSPLARLPTHMTSASFMTSSIRSTKRPVPNAILRHMDSLPIGVFDSGLGGLTVAHEIMTALPHERIVYLGDTSRCPYGPRSLDEVRRFVLEIGAWLSARPVKLLVIACNTATAAGLPLAQRVFDVPVIGVIEPGARAAVRATVNRSVGVIGTVGTVESGAYSQAVRGLDAGVTVFSVATPKFVDVVEAGLRMGPGALEDWVAESADVFVRPSFYQMARDYLDPLKRSGIDTLVLGCTHFPLLSAAIQQVVGARVTLISSAEETAREVAVTLERRGDLTSRAGGDHVFATTGDPAEFQRLGSRVLRSRLSEVEHVSLDVLRAQVSGEMLSVLEAIGSEEGT